MDDAEGDTRTSRDRPMFCRCEKIGWGLRRRETIASGPVQELVMFHS
ncbi:MAG: hypothetical protein AAF714_03170 [Pseudomonadota bacterium]